MSKTHYGDEDPDVTDATGPESEQELFETAKHLGWNPDDMRDKAFASKYREWLKTAPPEPRDGVVQGECSMASEKELDLAFKNAICGNDEFRQWFLSNTRLGGAYPRLVLSRADHPWCKAKLFLPNPTSGALEMVRRDGETDVLLVFEGAGGKRAAFHVENKRSSGSFTLHQPEGYAARAAHWIGKPRYGGYHEWETVLLAPRSFYERNLADARKFQTFIPYEAVAAFIPSFGQ
jgi:hypothetical protein